MPKSSKDAWATPTTEYRWIATYKCSRCNKLVDLPIRFGANGQVAYIEGCKC